MNTCLYRPRAKLRYVPAFTNGYRSILVQFDFPIGIGGLVEQNAAHRKRFLAEKGVDERLDGLRHCEFPYHRDAQQIPLSMFGVAKVYPKLLHHLFGEAIGNNCKPVFFNTRQVLGHGMSLPQRDG